LHREILDAPGDTPHERATPLRQVHLSKKRLVSRIDFQVLQKRIAFNVKEIYVLLRECAI
jgi:hypothetical protein